MVQKGLGTSSQKPQSAAQTPPNYEKISQDPLKFVVTFIEKKIRNLDKRKAKLDGYRKMVEDGKPLGPDQTAAAAKYDEVMGSLEFAKDLIKNLEATTNEVSKQQRKALRKEQMVREEAESNKAGFIVTAMRVMELLHDNEAYRDDFQQGKNGAFSVAESEMDQLMKFYELYVVKSYEAGANVLEDGNKAGAQMYELVEARSKVVVGTTYKELKTLLEKIFECGYFEELVESCEVTDGAAGQSRLDSVESESLSDDVGHAAHDDKEVSQENGIGEEHVADRAVSPRSETPTSPSFSEDVPLKTEEFVPSVNAASTWQQTTAHQQVQLADKPAAGDYLHDPDTFQYSSDNPRMMRRAYEAQRIQEVLAEVQGPCQFLQESIIDHETNTSATQYPAIDVLRQSVRSRPAVPAHVGGSAVESAFQTSQNLPGADQSIINPAALSADSEHLPADAPDRDGKFRNAPGSNAFMPAAQANADYAMGHPSRQQGDNLGLGQTTFGDAHRSYGPGPGETVYAQDETPGNAPHSITQPSNIQNAMQPRQIQSSGSPVPHIPLPNEQQSGYRPFEGDEIPLGSSPGPTQDHAARDKSVTEQARGDVGRSGVSDRGGGSPQQSEPTFGGRGGPGQTQTGPAQHRGRGGGPYNAGYRSGGQGSGNYQQRYSNGGGYRGRYNGNFDGAGRPNYNNFQGSQSGGNGGYRNQPDHYSGGGYRRGGGGLRNNRGGGQGRGNPRGGSGYNRTRTYNRPHQSEQAA